MGVLSRAACPAGASGPGARCEQGFCLIGGMWEELNTEVIAEPLPAQRPEQRSLQARHLAGPLARVALHTAGPLVPRVPCDHDRGLPHQRDRVVNRSRPRHLATLLVTAKRENFR